MAPSTTAVKNRKVDEDIADGTDGAPPTGCGILGRYPILSLLLFAVCGLSIGIGLSFWEPEDMDTKKNTLKWLGLIGDLFIRSLKCVVLPLVFVNVIISVMEMMKVGKASSIGWKTLGLYLTTTVFAAILGILTTVSVKGLYEVGAFETAGPAMITLEEKMHGVVALLQKSGSIGSPRLPGLQATFLRQFGHLY